MSDAPESIPRETPAVMGILNVTPDSFSGDGLVDTVSETTAVENAMRQAESFLADGADILDIGGESTRPGSASIDADAEWARIGPVVEAIHHAWPDAVISVDTYKAAVARAGVRAGAAMINDVWGGRADPDMLAAVAELKVPIVLMHNRSKPSETIIDAKFGGIYLAPDYRDFMPEILLELRDLALAAGKAGVAHENIVLDPGIGFGKTDRQNMMLVSRVDRIRALGYPVLLGPSRKGFIGRALGVTADDRVEGTAATVAMGILKGADIVRVHDVRAIARVVKMMQALMAADDSANGHAEGAEAPD